MPPFIPQRLPIRDIIWEPLIPLIGRANRSVAQYDGVLYGVPNPEVLLSPLTTQEAVLSSRIEGTIATLGEVLKYEAGEEPTTESRKTDIQEIINYRRALMRAEQELADRPFSLNLLLDMHSILLDSVRGKDKGRGRFRTSQNWIGLPNTPMEHAHFVPPEPSLVANCMGELESYYHSDRPDPIVQLAVVHAQFEIIHPFLDGNGRLGRLLIPLFLYEKQLLSRPMFYLSSYIEDHKDEYVSRLRVLGTTDDSWNSWVAFFLKAVDEQARLNAQKARLIIDLYRQTRDKMIALTKSQYAIPMLDYMFRHPVFRSTDFIIYSESSPSRQASFSLVRSLRAAGLLKVVREGTGRRPQILAFADLINLCEGDEVI